MVLKPLRFVFLTGVSKFSKVLIFSGPKNLNDITLDAYCSAICGYTEAVLWQVGYFTVLEEKRLRRLSRAIAWAA